MRVRRFILRWAVILGVLFVVISALALLFENKLVYPAMSASADWREPSLPSTQDVWLATADGTKIHGWYLPFEGAEGAILFSHGNGGNLCHREQLVRQLRETFQRPVFIYDYPGYGKSEGKPSESACYAAGESALKWLTETQNIPAGKIILCGESLGGGVAVELGMRHDSEGLLLISTFLSLPKAAKAKFPFLPCEWLMANRYESFKKIPNYRKPVFITHGDIDDVIPFEQGQRLFDVSNEPKQFHKRPGDKHNSAVGTDVFEAARQFFEKQGMNAPLTPNPSPATGRGE